jgi:acyl-CoA hydrolase
MRTLTSLEETVDVLLARVGKRILLATPLGIGKPNQLLNALYRRVKADPTLELVIHTALTLQKPQPKSELERRFYAPLLARVFGNYPDLDYELDRVAGRLPPNVRVIEFYFVAGKYLDNTPAQRDYISTNYTHVARDLLHRGINVVAQEICASVVDGRPRLSLSSNPDLSLDIMRALREQTKQGRETLCVGQLNDQLPFMYGDAEIDPDDFDIVLDDPSLSHTLFGPPKVAVADAEAVIGLYASALVRDGGELQIGIGALGDALTYALQLRQRDNEAYVSALRELRLNEHFGHVITEVGATGRFEQGLFAATEMLVDGFMHLIEAGILKRKVYDDLTLSRLLNAGRITEHIDTELLDLLRANRAIHSVLTEEDLGYLLHFGILRGDLRWEDGQLVLPDGSRIVPDLADPVARPKLEAQLGDVLARGAIVHAGFFVGPQEFYRWLRALPEAQLRLINMRSVTKINQLYGHEDIDRLHRRNARFINTAMKVTLLGATVSDSLEDGRVVSGVGGQYNFVAMAHELPSGRSVIQVRSTRSKRGELQSNLVWSSGNATIPRHLRDLVITEYGIADLRSKTDEECIKALLNIADSRFQPQLIEAAERAGKLARGYRVPAEFQHNLPESYRTPLKRWKQRGLFPTFPFGTDLTREEQHLSKTLLKLKASVRDPKALAKLALSAVRTSAADERALEPLLRRMDLHDPKSASEKFWRRVLIAALQFDRTPPPG